MTRFTLKKILSEKSNLSSVISPILEAIDPQISIHDVDGLPLLGAFPSHHDDRLPIWYNQKNIGWISDTEHSSKIAALLTLLVEEEEEKISLAMEALDRARELDLLHHLSEKLAAAPHPKAIALQALIEASTLIQITGGLVLLREEDHIPLEVLVSFGRSFQLADSALEPGNLIGLTLETGQAELANDVPAGKFIDNAGDLTISLLCAPLKTERRILGVLVLVGDPAFPYTPRELKLVNSVAHQTAAFLEISRLYDVSIEKDRLQLELRMAHEVQVSLLPKETPQSLGWEFAAQWCPSREVAGDFFDFIPDETGNIGMVIADVTDKGLPAALFMAFTRSVLRACMDPNASPAQIISRANQLVCSDSSYDLFVTLIYARLNPKTGELIYVNAGHNPPLLYSKKRDEIAELGRTGLPLGIQPDADYTQESVQLDPGDFIFFYTDGLTDAIDAEEQEFGKERVIEQVFRHRAVDAEALVATLEDAVDAFEISPQHYDDITILVARRV